MLRIIHVACDTLIMVNPISLFFSMCWWLFLGAFIFHLLF